MSYSNSTNQPTRKLWLSWSLGNAFRLIMGRKENVLRAQYSLWLQLGTQYTHSHTHTHTHTHGVGPVQIRCRTNLVESDQEKKWDVGLIIYTTSLIAQCLALWIGTVKLSGAILAVEFTLLFPFLFTFYCHHSVGGRSDFRRFPGNRNELGMLEWTQNS